MRRRGGQVQQWVDSIPSYGTSTSSYDKLQTGDSGEVEITTTTILEKGNNSSADIFLPNEKIVVKNKEMTATAPIVIPNSPAITMTCSASSAPHNRLVRDPSLQSDSSHCSSVESLLEWRKADPEAILLGLGFGYPSSPQENGSLARIPRRFLQPSKLKGIAVDKFLKQQQQSSESLETASLGYRGLTGSPYVAPSEIVQKIMECLREHESHDDSFTHTNSSGDLFGSMQQDGRLSVLSPDNRQYLARPRSKSPDMRNKRMIIGAKSFAFGYNGDLIEVESLDNAEEMNFQGILNSYQNSSNDTTIKSENGVSGASIPAEKIILERAGKLSTRKLAKQLSFDEDNSDDGALTVNQRLDEDQTNSITTVASRWSERNNTVCKLIIPERFSGIKSESSSRRASDSTYDLKLGTNMNTSTLTEDRRMSDGGMESKVQKQHEKEKKKSTSDKKPSLKRQARVSEADAISCEMEIVTTCQDLFPIPVTGSDSIEDYASEDETLRAECNDDRSNVSWTFNINEESDDSKTESNSNLETHDQKVCCINGKDECCKNNESNQIYEHDKTATNFSCPTSAYKCWKKMAKVMRRNEKLENIVARKKQEVAELREKLNSVISLKTESGS